MNTPNRITHQDIARCYGCDKSTVSLALRGSHRLPSETREKICKLAEEMGYRPDPAIAMLARHRWTQKGIQKGVTLHYLVHRKKEPLALQLRHFKRARERAEERGYQLSEFDLSIYPSGAAASRVLVNRGARGLILPPIPPEVDDELHDFKWEKFTAVGCLLGWVRTPLHTVTPDKFEGVRLAWQEAVRRGYRKPGAALFRHEPIAVDDFTRLGASYSQQQVSVAAENRIPFLLSHPYDRDSFVEWVKEHRPDVVISLVSKRVYGWLEEMGYRIPQDIGLITLQATAEEIYSGVSLQIDELAQSAVDFLIAQMLDNSWGIPETQKILLIEPQWIEGQTLPERK